MAILERTYGPQTNAAAETIDEMMISSDSHVMEPAGLWQERTPAAFKSRAPRSAAAGAGTSQGPRTARSGSRRWPSTA